MKAKVSIIRLLFSTFCFFAAPRTQGKGKQAGNQGELEEFYEATETWLAFYEEVRELAARKQVELSRELTSSADRGTAFVSLHLVHSEASTSFPAPAFEIHRLPERRRQEEGMYLRSDYKYSVHVRWVST